MARRRPTRHRILARALSWASPAQWVVLCVTLTVVAVLLVVSRRHSDLAEQGLRSASVHDAQATLGHQVQFLQSHQNLKHNNLLEDSLEDSDRIFKAAAVPVVPGQGTETTLDLTKNGNGFLSNIAEAQGDVPGVTVTAAPAVDSKPLGFYFAKDIPGLVKEKSLGTRTKGDSANAVDGEAAMRLYFNKDNSSSGRQDVHTAVDVQSEQVTTDGQQRTNEGAEGFTDTRSDLQHRKVLRGISKGIQARQVPEGNVSAGKSLQDFDRPAHVNKPINKTSNPLSVALNFSSVQTDDM
ncbi:hypothetical protein ABBQ38_000241 [Trebouxia sp. C0009 RCD-2024]